MPFSQENIISLRHEIAASLQSICSFMMYSMRFCCCTCSWNKWLGLYTSGSHLLFQSRAVVCNLSSCQKFSLLHSDCHVTWKFSVVVLLVVPPLSLYNFWIVHCKFLWISFCPRIKDPLYWMMLLYCTDSSHLRTGWHNVRYSLQISPTLEF